MGVPGGMTGQTSLTVRATLLLPEKRRHSLRTPSRLLVWKSLFFDLACTQYHLTDTQSLLPLRNYKSESCIQNSQICGSCNADNEASSQPLISLTHRSSSEPRGVESVFKATSWHQAKKAPWKAQVAKVVGKRSNIGAQRNSLDKRMQGAHHR